MAEISRHALAILRCKQVEREVRLSRSSIYQCVKDGTFPAPFGWANGRLDAARVTSIAFCSIPGATVCLFRLLAAIQSRVMDDADGMLRLDERLRNWASADRVWSDAVDAARIEEG